MVDVVLEYSGYVRDTVRGGFYIVFKVDNRVVSQFISDEDILKKV